MMSVRDQTVIIPIFIFTTLIIEISGQQVGCTHDLSSAGQKFSCIGETVVFSCNSTGNQLIFQTEPDVFTHAFSSIDPVPDVAVKLPYVTIVLTANVPNLAANVFITVVDELPLQLNITCSSWTGNILQLKRQSQPEPPSNIICEGLDEDLTRRSMKVSWTPPENPQFDIDYYIVTTYQHKQQCTTTTRDNSLIVEVRSREVYADVLTVSTCGTKSLARNCSGTVSAGRQKYYATIITPLVVGFVVAIVAPILIVIALQKCHRAR